ncbi:MAG TPA: tRNA (N(6)-L-threonylcarbamoyladenosine(37)-C(2))-methylthiotransferase MtaB [Firmicutes bacterium]|nr:tRNA (N(6)-L-threonylcarbamoyladenosine(37)-C(2))-methylthiotransferase MtaB [Bacillota bacterium]
MEETRTCAFATLGCKVNQYDTEALMAAFRKRGYKIVDFDSRADVYCINTCTVTVTSDHKSRQLVRRARKRNPDAVVVVTGCYAQVAPEEISEIPGVDVIVGTRGRSMIPDLVEKVREEGGPLVAVEPVGDQRAFEETPIDMVARRTRVYVKIQEGCNQFCAYCRVPFARGPLRSRRPGDVIAEVERLLGVGYKEIVLVGIHLGLYGVDLGTADENSGDGKKIDLAAIVERLLALPGEWRLRLSSIEPMDLDQTLIEVLASSPKAARHLHIPLQSGDAEILKLMGRPYSPEDYASLVERIRANIPECAITTDLMVGFPQETEERFERSLQFVRQMEFSRLHVFRYSKRPGTRAATFQGQVDAAVAERRSERARELGRELSLKFHKSMIGKQYGILIEEEGPGQLLQGLTDTYVRVYVPRGGEEIRDLLPVEVIRASSEYVTGRIVKSDASSAIN